MIRRPTPKPQPSVAVQPDQPPVHHPAPPPVPASPPSSSPRATKQEGWRSVLSTLMILLLAPLIALFLITYIFQTYQVDGQSMQSTLHNSDRLIIWKLPRTWARLTGRDYIPRRGDIIVFTEPKVADFSQNPDKQLIKRVIGLPGDRVVIQDGVVTVYNQEHPEGFKPDQTLPYGPAIGTTNTDTDVTVSADHLFVMGDNRGNSLDSRSFGPIEASRVVGKLVARVLPVGDMERF